MKNNVLSCIVAALLPFAAISSPSKIMDSYSYQGSEKQDKAILSESIGSQKIKQLDNLSSTLHFVNSDKLTIHRTDSGDELKRNESNSYQESLDKVLENPVSELIIIDQNVPDKSAFYRVLKSGVAVAEISPNESGLAQLKTILSNYQNLDALHLVSHAKDGELLLGNSTVTSELLKQELSTLSALDAALKDQGDVLLYGCELAKTEKGEQLLELIANYSNVDVAASNNSTGSPAQGGDWSLENKVGTIETLSLKINSYNGILALGDPAQTASFGTSSSMITVEGDNPSASNIPNSGFDITVTTNGASTAQITAETHGGGAGLSSDGSDMTLRISDSGLLVSYDQISLSSNNGAFFKLNNMAFVIQTATGPHSITFTGHKSNGAALGTLTAAFSHDVITSLDFTSPTSGTFEDIDEIRITPASNAAVMHMYFDDIVTGAAVSPITVTSATYDATTGNLVVTGTNFEAKIGVLNDVDVSTLTFTGENGDTYTLTTATDVEITSATEFTVTLSGADKAAVDAILNKNGTTATGSATYNLAAADDFMANVTAGDTSDATNALTVSNVAVPVISSATYNGSTGVMTFTGTNIPYITGATNDIDASLFTFKGEGNTTYTLVGSSDVEISSATVFSITLDPTDKGEVQKLITKAGLTATGGATYNIAAAEDWAKGANAAVNVVDATTGVTVSNVPVPTMTSATYNEVTNVLVVTGTNFVALAGVTNDIDISKLTFTGESGGTHAIASATDVEITSATQFSVTLSGADLTAVEALLNLNGTTSGSGTTYNLAGADDFNAAVTDGNTADTTNAITVSAWAPAITSATYDAATGDLVVTGTGFTAKVGATNDITASAFTITGEDGSTYTLTDTADVDRTSLTAFTLDLSATDEAAVNAIINKDGTTSTGGTTYNLNAADNFVAIVTAGDTSDAAGNGITVSNVAAPVITSATYNGTTGVLVFTGTNIPSLTGATNDIDASLFTFRGEGNVTYTLVGSSDVERTSATAFAITLDTTDKAEVQKLINKAGLTSTGGATYNIAAAEDWASGADAAENIADGTTPVTVSNVPVPTITSATYNQSTSALVVTGMNFVALNGISNDIDVTTLTFTGEAGGTFTLTGATANVEIDSVTQFTITVAGADVANVEALLNLNGTQSDDSTTYNLSATDDFNAGNTDGNTADATNAITVSGWPQPTITSATYDFGTGALVVTGTDIEAKTGGANDIDASLITLTGEAGVTYTLTDTTDVERDSATQFTLSLSVTDKAAVNAIINKDGTTATGGATYNIAAADNFVAAITAGNTADATNAVTVSNVATPTIASATYDGTTAILVVTGTNIPNITGANNDIDASTFTFNGEGNVTYTLVGSSDVERTSTTSFSITLDATDKAEIQKLINKAGLTATGGATYNLAAAEDWAVGAHAAVNVVDNAGNGVTVSNVPVPAITSATYSKDTKALVVTGVNFVALAGGANDIDVSMLTFTGEAGGTHTLDGAQTSDVEITSITSFTVTVAGTDVANIEALLNVNGTQSNDATTYNLNAADDFNAGNTDGDTSDATNAITVSGWPQPLITDATYDVSIGVLVVTGVDFAANGGGDDVDASAITFTGEDGTTYTLTDTSDVNIDSATQFTITLSSTDLAAVNALINKDGTSATGGQAYNISVADDFMTAVTAGNTSDTTGNAITVSNVTIPAITSATYNVSTGVLAVTGTDIPNLTGATNDIDASLFTFTGEDGGGSAYTLVGTPDVDRTSTTTFSLTLDATDKVAVQKLINKNGLTSTSGTTYNLAAAEDWATGADAAVNVVDGTNAITASNVVVPTISSVTYNSSIGVIVATGTNLLKLTGASNDIDLSTLTFTGEAGATYTLTSATDVEITSSTSFTATLAGADKTQVDLLLHVNGSQSDDATTYNMAAAEDWNRGADAAANIVDSAATVTVTGWPEPTLTSATYDAINGILVVTGTDFVVSGGGFDVDSSMLTFTGEEGATYTLTDTSDVNITNATTFTLTLSATDVGGANAVINNNGLTSTGGTAYNLASSDDFLTGYFIGDTSDPTGNAITVSNVPTPTIASATYDVTSGALVVTGTDIASLTGAANDIDASMFTFTGEGGTYTLIGTNDVERTSSSNFTIALDATDKAAVKTLMDKAGAISSGGITYNIAAAEDWAKGTNAAVNVVDNTNALTASNLVVIIVPPSNSPPVISEGSTTSVAMSIDGSPNEFSLTLNASDNDGDKLYWTISSLASHGSASVSGTGTSKTVNYTPNANYSGDDNFSVVVSDGNGGSDTISIEVKVSSSNNKAPIATPQSIVIEEDSAITVQPSGTDINQDELSFEVITQPSNGVISGESPHFTYTPNTNFNGDDSFSFIANDGLLDSEPAEIAIKVTAVNDNPIAIEDIVSRNDWSEFTIDVLANDTDVDNDTLVIEGATASNGNVTWSDTTLSYKPIEGFTGLAIINYSITDGKGGKSTTSVQIEINVLDSDLPVITAPANITLNATALATRVDLGVATAVDKFGIAIPVELVDGMTFFQPGINTVIWQATDSEGRVARASQIVNVLPLISFSKDQTVLEGSNVTVAVQINGSAIAYPLDIPYTVSGSASREDHNLTDGIITITSGNNASIVFSVFSDSIIDDNETLVISLDSEVNQGSQSSHTIQITEQNIAPVVDLSVEQLNEPRLIVNKQDGTVSIHSVISHPDLTNQYSLVWSSTEQLIIDSGNNDESISFDPNNVDLGLYHITLNVTDIDDPSYFTSSNIAILVEESAISLTNEDSDNDGIPDNIEGISDSDNDGIPDYLDNISQCNILPHEALETTQFLIEGESGVCLRLGDISLGGASGGSRIDETLIDTDAINTGGVFDFVAAGLPIEGQSYSIAIPQLQPIPANAVYRKLMPVTGWVNFSETANDQVMSAQGELGYCPPPGASEWEVGLTEGYWCVQLTIQDGGENDADGEANSTVVDPGGVAVRLFDNHLPIANDDLVEIRLNNEIIIDVLLNDTDEDNDILTVTSANANLGKAEIIDNEVSYTPVDNFFGVDTIIYGISDGQGGTDLATITVNVLPNQSPVVVNDSAEVTSGQQVLIDVLVNDSDPENDALSVLSAVAENGIVVINDDQKLAYTANTDFSGTDTIIYIVRDAMGGEALGTVQVNVTAVVTPSTETVKKKGGGTFDIRWLFILLLLVKVRHHLFGFSYRRKKAFK